jgi:ubiquinone/menaquinone biosynthesis C-methylase UbiE
MLSAFVPVEFYDYRPANLKLSNLRSAFADLTKLHFQSNSIESLSCMHVVEHVGLGRYGDPLDASGDVKAIRELKRVVAPEGHLLFVTPIGKPKIAYNAHRIYSYRQISDLFSDFTLTEYTLIPDDAVENGPVLNASEELTDQQTWGCGCFWFTKKR